MTTLTQKTSQASYWQYALWLAIFTVLYNIAEGLVSIFFGVSDEALTLFGFGADSFIEVMSGIGILAMVIRIRQNPDTSRSRFEITALRVTGTAFYLLVVGLGASCHLQSVHRTQAGDHPAGTDHLRHFDCDDVAARRRQTQGWARTQFRPHSCGRELHACVHLHVGGPAGFQPDLRSDRLWLRRQHRRAGIDLLFGQRGTRSLRESQRHRM